MRVSSPSIGAGSLARPAPQRPGGPRASRLERSIALSPVSCSAVALPARGHAQLRANGGPKLERSPPAFLRPAGHRRRSVGARVIFGVSNF